MLRKDLLSNARKYVYFHNEGRNPKIGYLQSAHEGNKMDVIGSFDHSFIIELRRERLHAMLQLFEQTIRANATAEESPRIGFELDSNGKWDPSFLGKIGRQRT